jgi:hypothetical protein
MNLLFLFIDARVRIKNIDSNLFHCILFKLHKNKKYACKK